MKLTPWEPDLRSLVDRIEKGDIDLQPDFQRQEVWSLAKKRRLIDTVIRGWSIPPVHLVTIADGKLEVLDGQQRLAAIRDFLSSKFSIDGKITPLDEFAQSLHGKFYKKLDVAVRRNIDQYTLRCFRISDYAPEEPSELFYRLNQPTMLTAGEQRNALYGPARQQLKDLVTYFSSENSKDNIGFSNVRLAYDDILARVLFFVEIGNFGIKGTESRISERFRSRTGFPDDVVLRVRTAVRHFTSAREEMGSGRFNKASLLSWLIFFCRFTDFDPNYSIIRWYYSPTAEMDDDDFRSVRALFEDRASLRVTDVSSVVFRDVSLWYIYSVICELECPESIEVQSINRIENDFIDRNRSFEQTVASAVDIDAWGQSI